MQNQNDTPKPVPAEQPSPSGLDETACSPSLSDFERGPWSYDLYGGDLDPVALLNNPEHSQGEWVSIEDYRKMERERNMARSTAKTFRQCAEVTFGVMPFQRKFHWENAQIQP